MYSYVAYGTRIESYLALPQLTPAAPAGNSDVRVFTGPLPGVPFASDDPAFRTEATTEGVWIRCGGVGTFLIRNGAEIVVDPDPSAADPVLRSYIVKAALAAVLHQRGRLILHASAVAVNGAALAFLGSSGMGKSTTTAALHSRGHKLLADDLVAVDTSGPGIPRAFPGTPHIALFPEPARAVGENPAELMPVSPKSEKVVCEARHFASDPVELRGIYVLAQSNANAIDPIKGKEALLQLIANSYGLRVFQARPETSHFRACMTIVERVPVRRLSRTADLSALDQLAEIIEDDVARNR
ncbi:MAG: hypothetical protein ABR543_10825 [Gemmatimonadaceae bacterium]